VTLSRDAENALIAALEHAHEIAHNAVMESQVGEAAVVPPVFVELRPEGEAPQADVIELDSD
jgi:hypothetical protein